MGIRDKDLTGECVDRRDGMGTHGGLHLDDVVFEVRVVLAPAAHARAPGTGGRSGAPVESSRG